MEPCVKEITDRKITIYYKDNASEKCLEPIAVESCMVPGTFRITPMKRWEDETYIYISNGKEEIKVRKVELEKGLITLKEEDFLPKIIRRTGGCNPCTNCGRCSW